MYTRNNPYGSLCIVLFRTGQDGKRTIHIYPLTDSGITVIVSKGTVPDWFRNGVEAALKAPTAMNQQKFVFGMKGGQPAVKIKGMGPLTQKQISELWLTILRLDQEERFRF